MAVQGTCRTYFFSLVFEKYMKYSLAIWNMEVGQIVLKYI